MRVARWQSGVCAPVPAGDPKARAGGARFARGRSELHSRFLLAKWGGRGWARAKFYKHLVSPGVKWGKQEAIGWGPEPPRGGEQRGPQHPEAGGPEKPPSSDKEVFPPENDLRDPRPAPGGPQPRSTVCRLDGFLLNAWGALGLPRPRRARMLAEGLRKTPGAKRLAGEEEKRDGTGKPPGGNQGLHTR